MAKAWRLNAHKINAIRALEVQLYGRVISPTARKVAQAQHQSRALKPTSYPLLTGLLIRAGIQPAPLPFIDKLVRTVTVPITTGKSWLKRAISKFADKFIRRK